MHVLRGFSVVRSSLRIAFPSPSNHLNLTLVNRSFLFAVLSTVVLFATSAASDLTARIRAEAQACADALLSGDYAGLIARTHPLVVAEMGGIENAIAGVAEGMASLKSEGITMESIAIGDPGEPVAKGAVVGVLVPQSIVLKTPEGKLRQAGHMLAVSDNGGGTWHFIDTNTLDANSLQQYFPSLVGVINLPARVPPEKIPE